MIRPRFLLPPLLALLLSTAGAAQRRSPELRFEAPEALAPLAAELGRADPQTYLDAMRLLGLDDPGPPIRVLLAPEGSPAARRGPSWGVAYAFGAAGLVVLIPSRVPAYPDHSLETVLCHEVTHVLVARAAGRRPVPRWFNEGLALVAAREWGVEDQARLSVATVRRDGVRLAELDRRFRAGSRSAASAYALSAAFVRYLLREHGDDAAARILAQVARGHMFPEAFRRATGTGLDAFEERYWSHLDLWSKWVPFLTSSTTLWIAITGLALLAFRRRRERDAEREAIWRQEEERIEDTTPQTWVH